jgi:hypothetical protein
MLYVMLVGAYPFERPEDKTDSQKLQKMIQVSTVSGLGFGSYCCGVKMHRSCMVSRAG